MLPKREEVVVVDLDVTGGEELGGGGGIVVAGFCLGVLFEIIEI